MIVEFCGEVVRMIISRRRDQTRQFLSVLSPDSLDLVRTSGALALNASSRGGGLDSSNSELRPNPKRYPDSYFFRLDRDHMIDATQMGNIARFINHSCEVCVRILSVYLRFQAQLACKVQYLVCSLLSVLVLGKYALASRQQILLAYFIVVDEYTIYEGSSIYFWLAKKYIF